MFPWSFKTLYRTVGHDLVDDLGGDRNMLKKVARAIQRGSWKKVTAAILEVWLL